jgi:Ankyrin repeats (3 copies)
MAMTASKLPARPSLESLRKQAKKLARSIVAGNAGAIARARAQLPHPELPLSKRDAQLVLAREYGFPGWQDLIKEVQQRLGKGLDWAVSQAQRLIHDNDVEGLRQLLTDYPSLLSWRADDKDGGLLQMATESYGDAGDANREQVFTRAACAELLLDAGAVVTPTVLDGLIFARTRGLLDLFHRKGILPQSLKFLAAINDVDAVRARLETKADNLAAVNHAFLCACHLEHPALAAELLDRSITLDPDLGKQIDGGPGRTAFVQYITSNSLIFTNAEPEGLWQEFVMRQVVRAEHTGDLALFVDVLKREPWMLGDACVKFQEGLIQQAVLHDHEAFITSLLDLNPALLRGPKPPAPQAFGFAFTYAKTHLLPTLRRIWPMPDDLPHAAGNGDFESVKRWFDGAGKPALGDLEHHLQVYSPGARKDLHWGDPSVQQVLDTAFAWAVINNHFEIADFLLAHGADVNTKWSSHEPASIMHDLAHWHKNYEAMQFLIDRGFDLTIKDYRWRATAQAWALYAAEDEKMAQWLADAQKR